MICLAHAGEGVAELRAAERPTLRSRAEGGSANQVLARISTRCITLILLARRRRQPAIFIKQPASVAATVWAPVFSIRLALSRTIAPLIAGKRTANDPPKPQHSSARSKGIYSRSLTFRSSRSGSDWR